MNFFEHQNRSRKTSTKLVFLFGMGVAGIVLAVYTAVVIIFNYSSTGNDSSGVNWFNPELFLWVSLATLVLIIGASLIKIRSLRRGGVIVAESLGGRPVDPGTTDLKEKRLINVVEEMALAAGVPVPVVYLLDQEEGINAFAAGYGLDDAVVAVTRGCLNQLSRDELQGVVAHEFSHILNGDMRLNIHLIGMIGGILVLAVMGRILLQSGRRSGKNKSGGPLVMMGLAITLIGYIGVFFSRIIQSAVSRQREYLADASAVQFTRNPLGIGNALKKIAGFSTGTTVKSPVATETGHLFFCSAFKSIFATHPPLTKRIQAIDSTFSLNGSEGHHVKTHPTAAASPLATSLTSGQKQAMNPREIMNRVGTVSAENIAYSTEILDAIPEEIRDDLRNPFGASCVIYALLLDAERSEKTKQIAMLTSIAPKEIIRHVLHLDKAFRELGPEFTLPLMDLAIPALRRMSPKQYQQFKHHVSTLVEADDKITLFEFTIQQIMIHRLDAAFFPREKKEVYRSIEPLMDDAAIIISKLATVGHENTMEVRKAFSEAMKQIPVPGHDDPNKLTDPPLIFVGQAISKFALARPGVRQVLLDACAHCVLFDRTVNPAEAEMLRAVAYAVDLPLPPFLTSSVGKTK